MVIAEAVAEAVNTEDVEEGSTTPPYDDPPNSTPWTTPSPQISTAPAALSFSASVGGANPASQTLEIWNSGGDTLSYTVEDDKNWLSVYPTSGTSTAIPPAPGPHTAHSLSVSISGLAVGTYSGTITIRDPLASNNPKEIPVTLTISSVTIPAEWTNQHGPENYSYEPVAMAVDSLGNTYVTGKRIFQGEGEELDYCTIKINNLGELVWEKIFDRDNNDEPAGIVIDEDGNVIVTGSSGYAYDFVTIKYSGDDGAEMWSAPAIYNRLGEEEEGNADDMAKAIAVDSGGNIFVTGSSVNELGHTDFATIKYSGSEGAPLWSVGTVNGAVIYTGYTGVTPGEGEDVPVAIALDSAGDVFVTGSSETSTNLDYATIKYDGATGNPLWSGAALYDGPMHSSDVPRAMAVDSAGDVVVTGSSQYGSGSGENYATIKYDGDNGNIFWTDLEGGAAVFMGPGWSNDVPAAMAIDPSGNVYVTGSSYYWQKAVLKYVFATIKLNGNNGSSVWVARYAGPGGEDSPVAMAVDSSGNINVTGNSHGIEYGYDYITVRYDTDGNELWVRRYDGGGNDEAKAVALDSSGGLYVTGTSEGETDSVYCTLKYDPDKPLLGLVGYYPFNGNANDVSGNGHNGTVSGAALTQDRFGYEGSAYIFDGGSGYIDMDNVSHFNFGTGDFSLETWIQMNSASSGPRHILGKRMDETAPYQHGWTRLYSLDGSIRFEFNDGWTLSTPTTYNDGVWHHIAATRSSGAVSLYMDGQLIGSGTQTVDVSNSGSFKIGKWYFESSFNGKIDDVRLYNRALSATEVAEHYLR
jgi:hypothetical protein